MNGRSTLEEVKSNSPSHEESGNIYIGSIEAVTLPIIAEHKISSVLTVMTDKEKRKCKLEQRIDDLDSISKHMSFTLQEEDHTIAPYFQSGVEFIR
jgi:hypothetical protein